MYPALDLQVHAEEEALAALKPLTHNVIRQTSIAQLPTPVIVRSAMHHDADVSPERERPT